MKITILHHHLGRRCFFHPPNVRQSKLAEDTDAGCLLVACQSGSRYGYALLLLQMLGKKNRSLEEPDLKKRGGISLNRAKCFMRKKFGKMKMFSNIFFCVICWVYWEGDVLYFPKSSLPKLPIDLCEIGMCFPPTWSVALYFTV